MTRPEPFTLNDVKEELSYAYVHAVAAAAGYSCDRPHKDRSSLDVVINCHSRPTTRGIWFPKVNVQVKATSTIHLDQSGNDRFTFDLPIKNYDDLRRKSASPSILVVLLMPKEKGSWLTTDAQGLIARRCAFWCSLFGLSDTANRRTKSVTLLTKNRFDVKALKKLMMVAALQGDIFHES